MEYLLTTNAITKQYGKQKAVNAVSLCIRQGDIYGLIGRNGAGKTTLLKMISGLAAPTDGSFSLFGKSGREAGKFMSRIGLIIEAPGVYPNLSAADNIRLKCLAMGVRKKDVVGELLNIVGLSQVGKKKVKNFSLGMKQRLGLALALVGDPDLIILDEPLNGLDPQGIAELRDTIYSLNQEKHITFIISSHILEELSKMATSYGIIHNGELIEALTHKELMEKCKEKIVLKTDNTKIACTILENMGFSDFKVVDADTIHIFERLTESGNITMALAKSGVKTISIFIQNETLENYYLNLTGGVRHA